MKLFSDNYFDKLDEYIGKAENIEKELMPYADIISIAEIKKVIGTLKTRVDSFRSSDRKLNIGIVGLVKAGKSTFLNTLLFDGKDVLPKAPTPKTAALTKIEYGEQNSICVNFYSKEEWECLTSANGNDDIGVASEVSKEIARLDLCSEINAQDVINEGERIIEFSSHDKLMEGLNEYVGENGKYTPYVKYVTLRINDPELKDISIVDTPGLNDPILLRTEKTKEFLKVCDVVFFLSLSIEFLANEDKALITSQLPSDGVAHIVMISSQFDRCINFSDYDEDDDLEAIINAETRKKEEVAEKTFDQMIRINKENGFYELNNVIEECKKPICISSLAWNMSQKDVSQLNGDELTVYNNLNENADLDDNYTLLEKVGNIPAVKKIFDEVVAGKTKVLEKAADEIIPHFRESFNKEINIAKKNADKKLSILKTKEKAELETQKKNIMERKNGIQSSIAAVFSKILTDVEQEKVVVLSEIRTIMNEASHLDELTDEKWNSKMVRIKDSKWYKPWTWGSYHYEDHGYTEVTHYYNASQAIDNINIFANTAQNEAEAIFTRSVDVKNIKFELVDAILNEFDQSDERFDVNFFRMIIENNIAHIDFPTIYFDSENLKNKLLTSFQNKIINESEKNKFIKTLNEMIGTLFSMTISQINESISKFKANIIQLKDNISDGLISDINNEYDQMCARFDEKNKQIEHFEKLVEALETITI